MAFYRAVIRVATGITVPVTLIGVEKKEPCSARVIELSADDFDVAEKINSEAIKRLRECYATGVWPPAMKESKDLSISTKTNNKEKTIWECLITFKPEKKTNRSAL